MVMMATLDPLGRFATIGAIKQPCDGQTFLRGTAQMVLGWPAWSMVWADFTGATFIADGRSADHRCACPVRNVTPTHCGPT
jgi:hypothetical protein